ncbi:MAG: tail protein X [Acidobacteria bacterium]|nr:tail protein X [Acidobacteriota bacterium]
MARIRTRVRGALGVELPAGAYVTSNGDVLDEICWRHYGREGAVPHVLAATGASPTPIPCCRPARCSCSGAPTAVGAAEAEAMDGGAGRGRLAGETASRLAARVSCAR